MTLCHPRMHLHTEFGIPISKNRIYAPDSMQFLETRLEVKFKVTVTQLWYATLCHPKMHPHTKFKIPTSNNIASQSSFGGIKYLGVTISGNIAWSKHVNKISKKANSTMAVLRPLYDQLSNTHQQSQVVTDGPRGMLMTII